MVVISFEIQDEDLLTFKNAFLKENPIPIDSTLTPLEWIQEWGRLQYLKSVVRGELKLIQETTTIDPDIILCSPTS